MANKTAAWWPQASNFFMSLHLRDCGKALPLVDLSTLPSFLALFCSLALQK
jgi:hypothetical protein